MQPRKLGSVFAVTALLTGVFLAAVGPGCTGRPGIISECEFPIYGRLGHDGELDTCCKRDPCPEHCLNEPCPDGSTPDGGLDASITDGAASASCSGDCVPLPPDGWSEPHLFWFGPEGTAPACPDRAPVIAYQGHAGLVAPAAACSGCTCSPSSGTCSPPPHLTASTLPCNQAGGVTTPFDGPAAWDGGCTPQGAIPPGKLCNGVACARSLVADALVVNEQGCAPPSVVTKDLAQPSWTSAALACRGTLDPLGACVDHGQTCVPAASLPDFRMCVYQKDDNDCPASYPDKHLVYAAFTDTRACTDCTCGAPTGSACTAVLGVFKDGACTTPLLSAPIGSPSPSCFDLVPSGPAVGSKTVTAFAYQPGACAPGGGDATGAAEPSGASTFCCLA